MQFSSKLLNSKHNKIVELIRSCVNQNDDLMLNVH